MRITKEVVRKGYEGTLKALPATRGEDQQFCLMAGVLLGYGRLLDYTNKQVMDDIDEAMKRTEREEN